MKFIVIYKNEPAIRAQVLQIIIEALLKGIDFGKIPIQHPSFFTRPYKLSADEMQSVPLDHQLEELLWKEQKLVSLYQLVIDV